MSQTVEIINLDEEVGRHALESVGAISTLEQMPQGQYVKTMVVSLSDAKRMDSIRRLNGVAPIISTVVPRR